LDISKSRHLAEDKCRKPEGKRPLGRPRHKWKDIRMNIRETR
jgi:hypothetical protein